MPLPHQFLSGNIARSDEVNRNFNYIMSIIGQGSTPEKISSTGEIVLGPRSTGQLTAAHDSSSKQMSFFQMSWNADWNKVGSVWRFGRRVSGETASALRVGDRGFEILGTDRTTGDLGSQMLFLFRIDQVKAGRFMFIPFDLVISTRNDYPTNLEHMRLTTTLLNNPISIYKSTSVSKGTTIKNAYNYGIPKQAKSIIITAHVTAANWSGAGIHFYQRQGRVLSSNMYKGLVVHAPITGSGMGMRAGAQGIVPLGTGTYDGDFVIHRTADFELANVYIIGYQS